MFYFVKRFVRTHASVFKLSVITDEITQDFGRAVEIAAKEFQLEYVEIRSLWGKNILRLDENEIAEVRKLLQKYHLQVICLASPLFKVDWPEAPLSQFSPARRSHVTTDFSFQEQDYVNEWLHANLVISPISLSLE